MEVCTISTVLPVNTLVGLRRGGRKKRRMVRGGWRGWFEYEGIKSQQEEERLCCNLVTESCKQGVGGGVVRA